ncbi:hypothetical protein HPB49_017954 [Dermacentor silvarum]|uniref:Uncharacterized protein n=1 Tax=Dermacentor silvarum TaxID=543639 RepID=A0ACB8D765_DERSI|nr:hypothetical protein HPB49_017954 [Dermacentor silvarum]
MAALPAAPKRPLKSILRRGSKSDAAGAAVAPPAYDADAGDVGGAGAQVPSTNYLSYDPAESSNQAAMASFTLCALCGLAVLVSAASFYVSRAAAGGDEVTPAVELIPANVSEAAVTTVPDARAAEVHVTSGAEDSDATDAEDATNGEWTGENETSMPLDESEQVERAPMLVKHANLSVKSV